MRNTHLLVTLLLGASPALYAQQFNGSHDSTLVAKKQDSTRLLNEVIISAGRKPQNINNIPSSVTIVNQKAIAADMAISTDITDILAKEVPGLAPGSQTSSNVGQSLRGRPLLIMVDGIPQSSPLRNGEVDLRSIDPAVLQRVEVIKGATAIYGNGAAGGLINYITLNPPVGGKTLSGKTSINFTGSLVSPKNTAGGRIGQSLYGNYKKFDYAVSGVYEQTGAFKDAEGDVIGPNYSLGETESYNAFAKMGYRFSSSSKLQLMYNYYGSRQNSNYTLVDGNYAEGRKATGVLGKMAGVPTGVKGNHNLHLVYQQDNLPAHTSLTADAYLESRDDVFYVSIGRFDGGDGQSRGVSKKKGLRFFLNTPLISRNPVQGEISYGIDLINDRTSQPLVDGRTWVPEMNMFNWAPFAQAGFTFFKDWILKGGIRMEKVNIGVDDYTTLRITNASGATVTPSFNVKGGALRYTATTANVGLRYNRFALFAPYISFSQGFSVSDIGLALRDAKVNTIAGINTEAVLINNYEAGFSTTWEKLRFEANAYISTSRLGSEMVFDAATGLFNVSRSPEKIYGWEASLQYQVLHNLNIGGSYSYVEGKRDINDNGKYNDPEDTYLNGRRIPPQKFTGNIEYSPVSTLDLRLQYVGIGSRSRFEKNSKGTYNGNEGPVKAYNLFNFSGNLKLTKATMLTMGVENLFNEDYFPARAQWFMIPGFYAKGKGRAFNIGLTVTY
ncbi:MAG TPA: TonB-dependent receptor [Chitinophaga sp.]|uniref:TonB-dependent receptor n=1 Tax=Chitinophaga sp. TaxID=1869181 RepID=UPI002CDD853A|nr:TonB-dependent receptor [Chitinophaga sp.]HVI44643.1 TonB-dependent receptor [Chitinophaga sp.]